LILVDPLICCHVMSVDFVTYQFAKIIEYNRKSNLVSFCRQNL